MRYLQQMFVLGEVSTQGHSSRHEGHSSRSLQGHHHGIDQWPGIETVMETYQRHNTGK